jgi:hypothetical protein
MVVFIMNDWKWLILQQFIFLQIGIGEQTSQLTLLLKVLSFKQMRTLLASVFLYHRLSLHALDSALVHLSRSLIKFHQYRT